MYPVFFCLPNHILLCGVVVKLLRDIVSKLVQLLRCFSEYVVQTTNTMENASFLLHKMVPVKKLLFIAFYVEGGIS